MRALAAVIILLMVTASSPAIAGGRIDKIATCLKAIDDANEEAARKTLEANEGRSLSDADREQARKESDDRDNVTAEGVQKCVTAEEAGHLGHLSHYSDGWLKRCGLRMASSVNFNVASQYTAITSSAMIKESPFFIGQDEAASISSGVKEGTPQAELLCSTIVEDFGPDGTAIPDAVTKRIPKLASTVDLSKLEGDPARDGAAYHAANFLAKICGAIKTKNHAALKRRNRDNLKRFDEQGRTLLATMSVSCSLEGENGRCPNYVQEKCDEARLEYGDGEVSDEYLYRSILKFE